MISPSNLGTAVLVRFRAPLQYTTRKEIALNGGFLLVSFIQVIPYHLVCRSRLGYIHQLVGKRYFPETTRH